MTTTTRPARRAPPAGATFKGTPRAGALPGRRGRIRSLTTPIRIRVLTGGVVLLAVAFGVATAVLFGSVSSGLQLIGYKAAPEVAASTTLYFHLNDMDAQVANVLLVGNQTGLGIDRQQAQAIYAQDRSGADQALQRASVVAGSSVSAQRALRTVLDGLGQYEALAGEAMYVDGQGAAEPGRPPAAALALYRHATDEMRMVILPAARGLTSANAAALSSAYEAKRSTALRGVAWLLLLGLAGVAALAVLQVYLVRRCRRLLNPALALASLAALVLTALGAAGLAAEAAHLRVAKVDAFDSILALTQARAVSYDANADESRFLVDPGRAAFYQQSFLSKSDELVGLPGAGIFQYDAALSNVVGTYHANHADVHFGGYLGAEFRNITFAGERAAAEKTLAAYQVYERDDRHIRALNSAGNLRAAIAFDTSYATGNSNWAFAQYDKALVSVITINQNAFSAAIAAGQRGAQGWTGLIPAITVLLILALVLVGVRPRLAEYS